MILRRCLRTFCTSKNNLSKTKELLYAWFVQDDIKVDSININGSTKIIGLPWNIGMTEEWSKKVDTVLKDEFNDSSRNPIVIQNDCAPNIGINRLFGLKVLTQKVFKGIAEPSLEAHKHNPNLPTSVSELYLWDQVFLDPEQKLKSQEEYKKVVEQFSSDFTKLSEKLTDPYKIDGKMQLFAGTAVLCGREVIIGGLSELMTRKIVATSVSLAALKTAFINCFSEMKTIPQPYGFNRDYFFETFSELLVPYENYMLYLVLTKLKKPVTLVCNAYNIPGLKQLKDKETVQDAVKINKVEDFEKFFNIQRNTSTSQDNDQILIEKHALIETFLETELWQEPYIKNMFPYLSEDYQLLSEEEQNTIKERYKYHLNRYISAKKKLLESEK